MAPLIFFSKGKRGSKPTYLVGSVHVVVSEPARVRVCDRNWQYREQLILPVSCGCQLQLIVGGESRRVEFGLGCSVIPWAATS